MPDYVLRFALPLLLIAMAVSVVAPAGLPASAAQPVPGTINTLVGPGVAGGASGPYGIAVNAEGTIVFADTSNRRIRQMRGGETTTIVGCEGCGVGGGPAGTNTILGATFDVAFNIDGSVLFTDASRCQLFRWTAGIVSVIAGTDGTCGSSGDGGPATAALLQQPVNVAVDAQGVIYVTEGPASGEPAICRIRRIVNGVISTFAGTGTCGYSGDGGPATAADIIALDLTTDASGEVYFADIQGRIRKIAGGTITTIAGTGTAGFSGDGGSPLSAQLGGPRDVTVAPNGDLYIADSGNGRIRKIANGIISTVAGGGPCCPIDMGDGGPATLAWLSIPVGVAVNAHGNLYIVDWGYDRVRIVYGATPATPTATATATPSPTLTPSAPARVRPVRTATPTTTATPQSLPTSIPTPTAPAPGSIAPNGQPPLAPSSNDGNEGDRAGASARPARLPNSGAGTRNTVGITDGIVFAAWAGVALLVSGAALRARKRG